MNNIIELITGFQTAAAQLREQQVKKLPVLGLYGDDCQYMDTSYIIEAISNLKNDLPPEFAVVADRIIADLALLNEMTNDENELIVERNEILDNEVSELQVALESHLVDLPETKMDRAVVINIKHMNNDEIQLLDQVYKNLKLTHVNREERKHSVYFVYDKNPKLHSLIVDEFKKVVEDSGIVSSLPIANYVQGEPVMGFISDLIKVIQSKQ